MLLCSALGWEQARFLRFGDFRMRGGALVPPLLVYSLRAR